MATIKEGHEDITMSIHVHVCLSSKLCLMAQDTSWMGWDLVLRQETGPPHE